MGAVRDDYFLELESRAGEMYLCHPENQVMKYSHGIPNVLLCI